jgi:hypothetical protein
MINLETGQPFEGINPFLVPPEQELPPGQNIQPGK